MHIWVTVDYQDSIRYGKYRLLLGLLGLEQIVEWLLGDCSMIVKIREY